jgi:hypothetical protein
VIGTARRLGIPFGAARQPSIALGTAEVTLLELSQPMSPSPMAGTG